MSQKLIFPVIIILVILVTGCSTSATKNELAQNTKVFFKGDVPNQVAKLDSLNLTKIERFEDYRALIEHMNTLIIILNEQELFNVPILPSPTIDNWDKISKSITKWSPLINNYNEVILSAKEYEKNPDRSNLEDFYVASGKFSIETALVVWSSFYGLAYNGVGIVYRSIGLNKYAVSCPTCVKAILSNAHWFVRTVLVEGSSKVSEIVMNHMQASMH